MKGRFVELLIVALMAIPIGAHGLSALISHRLWISPRHSKPYEMVGLGADLMGLAYFGVAACLFAVWFGLRSSHRKLGIGVTVLFALVSLGSFGGALYVQ
jgi:hypothetical protein